MATARIRFEQLSVRGFRNIRELSFEPRARLNVIAGDNGAGKTSLLEALYFVATSRSFRTENVRELILQGSEHASVHAVIDENGGRREQRAVLGASVRTLLIDGKRPRRLASYAVSTPVVVFHPGDLALTNGPAAVRRTLLDRLALFLDPSSGDDRLRYLRAMRERQRTLEDRGVSASDLDAFEQLAAEHGTRLQRARGLAAVELIGSLLPAFARIAAPGVVLAAVHRPGGSEDSAVFLDELAARRARDLRRKAASFGPQRDELELYIDGRSARQHASQGQQRILTLALKVAELASIEAARGAHPVLLLDDVSSELDPTRTGAVYDFVRETASQVFVTTTRPGLFMTPSRVRGERSDWRLISGALTAG